MLTFNTTLGIFRQLRREYFPLLHTVTFSPGKPILIKARMKDIRVMFPNPMALFVDATRGDSAVLNLNVTASVDRPTSNDPFRFALKVGMHCALEYQKAPNVLNFRIKFYSYHPTVSVGTKRGTRFQICNFISHLFTLLATTSKMR